MTLEQTGLLPGFRFRWASQAPAGLAQVMAELVATGATGPDTAQCPHADRPLGLIVAWPSLDPVRRCAGCFLSTAQGLAAGAAVTCSICDLRTDVLHAVHFVARWGTQMLLASTCTPCSRPEAAAG